MTGNRFVFGEIAVSMGFVDLGQVATALTEQAARGTREPVGSILVDLGYLSGEQRMLVIQEQLARIAKGGETLFGQLAVERGFITREALEQAVRDQSTLADAGRHEFLGEILIESGALLPHQAEWLLEIQKNRR